MRRGAAWASLGGAGTLVLPAACVSIPAGAGVLGAIEDEVEEGGWRMPCGWQRGEWGDGCGLAGGDE